MLNYSVPAYNTAHSSENKIHDDAVARRLGFNGALVPGVDVYAYMMHVPVQRWGRAFLERGWAECRLASPVYDGETVQVTGREDGDALALELTSRGLRCASGSARLPRLAAVPGERRARCRLSARRAREPGASWHGSAHLQPCASEQRSARTVDPRRQDGAQPRPRARRADFDGAPARERELRAQGASVRGTRCPGAERARAAGRADRARRNLPAQADGWLLKADSGRRTRLEPQSLRCQYSPTSSWPKPRCRALRTSSKPDLA